MHEKCIKNSFCSVSKIVTKDWEQTQPHHIGTKNETPSKLKSFLGMLFAPCNHPPFPRANFRPRNFITNVDALNVLDAGQISLKTTVGRSERIWEKFVFFGPITKITVMILNRGWLAGILYNHKTKFKHFIKKNLFFFENTKSYHILSNYMLERYIAEAYIPYWHILLVVRHCIDYMWFVVQSQHNSCKP